MSWPTKKASILETADSVEVAHIRLGRQSAWETDGIVLSADTHEGRPTRRAFTLTFDNCSRSRGEALAWHWEEFGLVAFTYHWQGEEVSVIYQAEPTHSQGGNLNGSATVILLEQLETD